MEIDLSFSVSGNFFSWRSVKLLLILEYILEIVQNIVWLWKQKFLHYTSHTTVYWKLYKIKQCNILWTEACSLNRNKKAWWMASSTSNTITAQYRYKNTAQLCVLQTALSQSQAPERWTHTSMASLLSLSKRHNTLNSNTNVVLCRICASNWVVLRHGVVQTGLQLCWRCTTLHRASWIHLEGIERAARKRSEGTQKYLDFPPLTPYVIRWENMCKKLPALPEA